jgi:hypothetical protein
MIGDSVRIRMPDPSEPTLPEALAEIERLRVRIVELEAAHARLAEAHAVALGTVGPQFRLGDEPFGIEHNVPGNAPV